MLRVSVSTAAHAAAFPVGIVVSAGQGFCLQPARQSGQGEGGWA